MDADNVSQQVAGHVHHGLYLLLSGEVEVAGRFLADGRTSLVALSALLETVPPLVDPERGELPRIVAEAVHDGEDLIVPLRDADGNETVTVTLSWTVGDEIVPGHHKISVAVERVERAPGARSGQRRSPDSSGRLPREQFVGSVGLRVDRLFNALPSPLEAPDRGPLTDAESAFQLQYGDGDIYNGSLHQFYSNSTGNFSGAFPDFADKIGAPRKAAAVRTANELFRSIDLRDRTARNAVLDALTAEQELVIDQQTDEYYDADESVTHLLAVFFEASPQQFSVSDSWRLADGSNRAAREPQRASAYQHRDRRHRPVRDQALRDRSNPLKNASSVDCLNHPR